MFALKQIIVYSSIFAISYFWLFYVKRGPIYETKKRLDGKTILITGGNDGIGKFTAIELAKRGARIIIASRNHKKSLLAKDEIMEESKNDNIHAMILNLESMKSVRSFAKEFVETEKHLDILINNAGVNHLYGETKNGINRIFAINHLGHFLLTNLLLEKIKAQSSTRPVRIINLSSLMYKFASDGFLNEGHKEESILEEITSLWYANSKLANVYFTSELDVRLKSFNITSFAVHPGVIKTNINRDTGIILKIFIILSDTFIARNPPGKKLLTVKALQLNTIHLNPFHPNPKINAENYSFNYSGLTGVAASPHYGAQTVLYCALDEEVLRNSGGYFCDCQEEEKTELAKNVENAKRLWDLSNLLIEKME